MDIRALVLVSKAAEIAEDALPLATPAPALLEVAGRSAVQRTIDRLREFGIQTNAVVSDSDFSANSGSQPGLTGQGTSQEQFWRAAENAFNELAQAGADLVLLVHLGGYAELNVEKFVQFHLDQRARVSQVSVAGQPVEIFCISASRRNDAASLLRSQLTRCRSECPLFQHEGYFNALADARDLRQFAIDILTLKTETRPSGAELRPGIWVERHAMIEKGARLLAPAFIGAFAKVRTHAVITRCSSVEHHAEVDCGTVVENSTVLPFCSLGAGLDVAHSVVGAGVVANLRRNLKVEIVDRKLVGFVVAGRGQRFLNSSFELITYLPRQAWRGLFGPSQPQPRDLTTALRDTPPSLSEAAGYQTSACDTDAAEKFPSTLAVARRYGQH